MADSGTMGRGGKSANPGKTRTVIKVKVNGTEKRYRPSRHYAYILQVRWSDYSEYVIYRKYSDFYTMQCSLLEKFPIEAGTIRASDRVIPYLPGRLIFSRTEVSKVANQRQGDLAQYCEELLRLDQKILTCEEVEEFFEPRPDDINPPKNITLKPERSRLILALLPFLKRYKGVEGSQKSRPKGTQKMRKAKSTTALNIRLEEGKGQDDGEEETELSISDPLTLETYAAIADYDATDKSEVSLKEGMLVDVFEKNSNGWWFVQTESSQGWAPASYLDPVSHPLEIDEPDPTYTGDLEKYITTETYKAQMTDEISFQKDVIVEVMHKLLDGWWIISYQGEAGYAPAAFLVPYQNPHLVESKSIKKRSLKPIPRRCTLKSSSKSADRSRKDLSIYRKYSKKRKVDQSKFTAAPPPPKPPRITEEEETPTSAYVNEAFGSLPEELEEEPEYLQMEHEESILYENVPETSRVDVPDGAVRPPAPPRPEARTDKPTNRISMDATEDIYDDIEDVMSYPVVTSPPSPPPMGRRENQLPPRPPTKPHTRITQPQTPNPAVYTDTTNNKRDVFEGNDLLAGLKKAQRNREDAARNKMSPPQNPRGGATGCATLPTPKPKQSHQEVNRGTLPAAKPKVGEGQVSTGFENTLRMLESSLGVAAGRVKPQARAEESVKPHGKPAVCVKPGVKPRSGGEGEGGRSTATATDKGKGSAGIASRVAQFEKSAPQ